MKRNLLFIIVLASILGFSGITYAALQPFNSLQLAPSPSNGNCLKTDGTFNSWSANCGSGGGGGGGGTWSTTTSQTANHLINYPNNNTDIVTIGNSATTSAPFWYDPTTKEWQVETASTTFNGGNFRFNGNSTTTTFGITSLANGLLQVNTNGSVLSLSTTTLTASSPLSLSNPVVKVGGSNSVLTIDTSGTWSGNAGTATALAANGTNCSAGNYPLGVDASGNSESCTLATTGTVTSIATNNGITGGTITTTGTIGLATINAGVLGATTNGSVPTSQATSTLYGVGTNGQVLGYSGGNLISLATTTFTGTAPISLTYAAGQVTGSCTTASAGVTGCLSGTDYNTFNGKQATISASWPIILTGATLSFGGLGTTSNLVAGQLPYATGVNTFGQVATTSVTCDGGATCTSFVALGSASTIRSTFPFTIDTNYGALTNSTSTPLWFKSGLQASSTSQFVFGSSTAWSATSICLTGDICRTTWPSSSAVGGSSGQLQYNASGSLGGVSTTTHSFSGFPASLSGTIGALVGGSNSTLTWWGLATSSNLTAGQLLMSNGAGNVSSTATGTISNGTNISVTNGGTASVLGSNITINLSGTVGIANGGTGTTTGVAGQLAYWNGGATNLQALGTSTVSCTGNVSCTAFSIPGTAAITINGTGGGGSGGTWSTTTSSVAADLINYPNNNTDIVTIGGLSTTTAKFYFDPNVSLANPLTGIGTTSPWGQYSIGFHNLSPLTPSFVIASSSTGTATSTEFIDLNSFIGIGTSSPASLFSINGIANFRAATTSFSSTGGIDLLAGCFAVRGVCVSGSGAGGVTSIASNGWLTYSGSTGAVTSTITYPWTLTTNYGSFAAATTSSAWYQNGLTASTTSYFSNLVVGSSTGVVNANAPLVIGGNVNNYTQAVIHNMSNGGNASADYIVENDKATDSSYYGDFGVNSSGNNQAAYTAFGANDTYLYSNDANLDLAAATTTGAVNIYAGGTLSGLLSASFSRASTTIDTTFLIASTSLQAFRINDSFGTNVVTVNTASTTGPIFTVAATTSTPTNLINLFTIDQYGHIMASSTGATPVVSSCGTGTPTVTKGSSDTVGSVTTGTGSPTACTITYGTPLQFAAIPFIQDTSGTVTDIDVTSYSTTGFTMTFAAALTSIKIGWIVIQGPANL